MGIRIYIAGPIRSDDPCTAEEPTQKRVRKILCSSATAQKHQRERVSGASSASISAINLTARSPGGRMRNKKLKGGLG